MAYIGRAVRCHRLFTSAGFHALTRDPFPNFQAIFLGFDNRYLRSRRPPEKVSAAQMISSDEAISNYHCHNVNVSGNSRVQFGHNYYGVLSKETQNVLLWLSRRWQGEQKTASSFDHWIVQDEIFQRYQSGTLEWFFCDTTYASWLLPSEQGGFQVL